MKKLALLILISVQSIGIFSQYHWIKHPDNPIMVPGGDGEWNYGSISPFTVTILDSTYHMYYHGSTNAKDWAIGHATSLDGITWTKDTNNPILDLGAPGEWDDDWISDPSVLKIDTLFHMWYTGHSGDFVSRIGHATSSDGIEWVKDTNNPVKDFYENIPETNYICHSPVLYDESLYHIYYCQGIWSSDSVEIWHATSQDCYSWIIDTLNPVIGDNTQIFPAGIVFDGDRYVMWYGKGSYWNWEYYLAISGDGSNWEKQGNNPVLSVGPTGSWDEVCFTSATALFESSESKYKMWYGGSKKQGEERIGYAESVKWAQGIVSKSKSQIRVFPIPTTDFLTLQFNISGYSKIEITSLNGQLLFSTRIDQPTHQIDLTSFEKGIYFITVRSSDQVWTKKIIKL